MPIIALLMIGFVVLDQLIKKMALSSLSSPVYLTNYLGLEISKNYGIAFGLRISPEIFYFVVLAYFVWLIKGKVLDLKNMESREILGAGLILSGALGNIIDRIRFGYIIDYINFKDIIIFNLADVLILAGAAILSYDLFYDKEKIK